MIFSCLLCSYILKNYHQIKIYFYIKFCILAKLMCKTWLLKVLQFIPTFTSIIHCHFASLLAGSRSSSPGKLLGSGYGGLAGGSSRGPPVTPSSEKRSKIPRSQGCSRETSPNRIGLGKDSQRSWKTIPSLVIVLIIS